MRQILGKNSEDPLQTGVSPFPNDNSPLRNDNFPAPNYFIAIPR